jgi:hypothetical protein
MHKYEDEALQDEVNQIHEGFFSKLIFGPAKKKGKPQKVKAEPMTKQEKKDRELARDQEIDKQRSGQFRHPKGHPLAGRISPEHWRSTPRPGHKEIKAEYDAHVAGVRKAAQDKHNAEYTPERIAAKAALLHKSSIGQPWGEITTNLGKNKSGHAPDWAKARVRGLIKKKIKEIKSQNESVSVAETAKNFLKGN